MRRLLSALALSAAIAAPLGAFAQELEIAHLRVGQGDATLILGPAGAEGSRVAVLFDAGNVRNPDAGAVIGEALAARGISAIDYFIVSHDDADHIGGAAAGGMHGTSFILGTDGAPGAPGDDDGDGDADWLGEEDFFDPDPQELGTGDDVLVRHFIDYGDALMRETDAIEKYRGFADAMGGRITLADQDDVDTFEIDLGEGARMILLAANGFVRGRAERVAGVNTPNERSLSFLVRFGGFDYLISGDLIGRAAGAENAQVERAVGEALQAMGTNIDVLHVNHHGADNASEQVFLSLIQPEVAIISAGNGNSHGHPTGAALRRLQAAGVRRVVQTEWGATRGGVPAAVRAIQAIAQDDIVITSDGDQYEIAIRSTWATDD